MTEPSEESAFEPTVDPFVQDCEPLCEASQTDDSELRFEPTATSHLPLWRPEQPQFCKAIAEYYGVSRKSVQQWFLKIADACPWFEESDLRLPDGRYTPTCVELMGDYRLSGFPIETWKSYIWARNPEQVERYSAAQQSQPAIEAELVEEPRSIPTADHSPIEVSQDYLEHLQTVKQQIENLAQQEQELVVEMGEVATSLVLHANSYESAINLQDELLLQRARLEGAQLAIRFEQERQEAFRSTRHKVATGEIVIQPPGKSETAIVG